MGDWFKDKKRQTYVATYDSDKDARKEIEQAAKHGWMPQSTATMRAARGITAHIVKPLGHGKEKVTITYVRRPEAPQQTVIVNQAPVVVSQSVGIATSGTASGALADGNIYQLSDQRLEIRSRSGALLGDMAIVDMVDVTSDGNTVTIQGRSGRWFPFNGASREDAIRLEDAVRRTLSTRR